MNQQGVVVEAPDREPSPLDRSVLDQRVPAVVGAGRQEPALLPDQGRQRQLVPTMGQPDAAFVEITAGCHVAALIPCPADGGNGRYAAPARLVRVSGALRASPICLWRARERMPLPQAVSIPARPQARSLPETYLSKFIERRVYEKLHRLRSETNLFQAADGSVTPPLPELHIRQVSCVDCNQTVRPLMFERYKV